MDNKKQLNSAGFYAVLGLVVVTLGIGGYALLHDAPKEASTPEVTDVVRQPKADYQPTVKAPAPAPVRVTPKPPKPAPMPESRPVAAGADLPAEPEKPAVPEEPSLIVYPVSGQVTATFSADDLQYSETLGDWRIHDGIDLSAKQGTTVLAACAGTVLSVEDDPLMGTTITIDHAGGYQTTYANLQAKPPVLAGDEVSAGQIIGAVGETAEAECMQAPHLHFSVAKDGTKIDPEAFLNP